MPSGCRPAALIVPARSGLERFLVAHAHARRHVVPDKEKTWAMSLLNRYEFCHEQEDTHTDPGQVFTTEWGLSKSHARLDIGFVGYYQQQVTEDSGPVATDKLDRKIGAGPEISAFWPKLGLFTSLRYAHEFSVVERPEGDLITLTLTMPF